MEPQQTNIFIQENRKLVKLTSQQELQLLKFIVPSYEAKVKKFIHVDLKQHEYDALVSFAYNPGYDFKGVINLINHGRIANAVIEIKKRIKSGGKVDSSLVARRDAETRLFVKNEYGKLRS